MVYKEEDRVRMIGTTEYGTVQGPAEFSGEESGNRQPVLWDNSGEETAWDPRFYRGEDTDPEENLIYLKSGRQIYLISPEGLWDDNVNMYNAGIKHFIFPPDIRREKIGDDVFLLKGEWPSFPHAIKEFIRD